MKGMRIRIIAAVVLICTGVGAVIYAQRAYHHAIAIEDTPAIEKAAQEDDFPDDVGNVTDDDAWKEMNQLVTAYYDPGGVRFSGHIRLIDDNGEEEQVIEDQPFEYQVKDANFYYSLAKMEVVNSNNLLLLVDNQNKILTVGESEGKAERTSNTRFFDIEAFKKLMQERKAVAKVTKLGDEKVLTIDNIEDPQIQGYRIYYDPTTYNIHKMLVGMVRLSPLDENSESNKQDAADSETGGIDTYTYYMEVYYDSIQSLKLGKSIFRPETRFVIKEGKELKVAPAFKDYRLIMNLESEPRTTNETESKN